MNYFLEMIAERKKEIIIAISEDKTKCPFLISYPEISKITSITKIITTKTQDRPKNIPRPVSQKSIESSLDSLVLSLEYILMKYEAPQIIIPIIMRFGKKPSTGKNGKNVSISKSTNIQSYYRIFFKSSYFNFVRIGICAYRHNAIPLHTPKKMNNRREMCCLRVRILIDLKVETQGQSQALLGFVIYIKNYGGSSVSNPLTPLVGATPPYVLKSKHKES